MAESEVPSDEHTYESATVRVRRRAGEYRWKCRCRTHCGMGVLVRDRVFWVGRTVLQPSMAPQGHGLIFRDLRFL